MLRRMLLLLAFLFLNCVALGNAAGKPRPTFPSAVQGIWHDDDDEGRKACKAFLAALKVNDDGLRSSLVGSHIVMPESWHSYAKDGGGDFYTPERVAKIDRQSWRIFAKFGPDEPYIQRATFRAILERGKLTWMMDTIDGITLDSWDEHRYFRCSPIPKGFAAFLYAS
jgi:hypothetical protein